MHLSNVCIYQYILLKEGKVNVERSGCKIKLKNIQMKRIIVKKSVESHYVKFNFSCKKLTNDLIKICEKKMKIDIPQNSKSISRQT